MDFQALKLRNQQRDLIKWRTAICNIAMHTKKQIQRLEKNENDLLYKMRIRDLNDTKKAMETRMMLDTMQIDS